MWFKKNRELRPIEILVMSGDSLSDISSEKLIELYNDTHVTSMIFNEIQQEIIFRIRKGKNDG